MSTGHKTRVEAVGQVAYLLPGCRDGFTGGRRISQVFDHDLTDGHRIFARGLEPAAGARQFGGRTDGRDDRRLFDSHGHHALLSVNLKMKSQGQRQTKNTDGVFDHVIGALGRQDLAAVAQRISMLRADYVFALQQVQAFI